MYGQRSPAAFLGAFLTLAAVPAAALEDTGWPKLVGARSCGMTLIPVEGPGGSVHELSGLAGDAVRLFAVSDQGFLVTLRPRFDERGLRSVSVDRVVELADVDGEPLGWSDKDAEGLALVTLRPATADAAAAEELWVSFERTPRIERFGLNGRRLGRVAVSKKVTSPDNFASPNKAFEALALVDGRPITAPERPARKNAGWVPLLGPDGEIARFNLAEVKGSSLVGLDLVAGRTLVAVERAFQRSTRRTVITLSSFELPERRSRRVKKWPLVTLDSEAGFHGIDNFEGVVSIGGGRVLLVSDDNESEEQRQLLLCLEVDRLKKP